MLTASCPAKLNVFLEVLGKRADGYHELETVMLRTSLCDQLSVKCTSGTGLSLRFSDATPSDMQQGIPLDESNLILRAAAMVRSAMYLPQGAEFILHKRIPPESGLAGGSSNAATTLLLCRELWNAPLSDAQLHSMAASLGSDINFLLSGYPAALCSGRGEQVREIPLGRDLYFIALRPRRGNSTADVFRATGLSGELRSSASLIDCLQAASGADMIPLMFNRLTEAGRRVNFEMDQLMSRLNAVTRRSVHMSGSGSTVFIAVSGRAEAVQLQNQIRERLRLPSWLLHVPRAVERPDSHAARNP
ncbi:MAG: 4-(cytidine 5'-diphospho)-2-C-methyl-D-erythritol kinase [Planctomycetota bacterium]